MQSLPAVGPAVNLFNLSSFHTHYHSSEKWHEVQVSGVILSHISGLYTCWSLFLCPSCLFISFFPQNNYCSLFRTHPKIHLLQNLPETFSNASVWIRYLSYALPRWDFLPSVISYPTLLSLLSFSLEFVKARGCIRSSFYHCYLAPRPSMRHSRWSNFPGNPWLSLFLPHEVCLSAKQLLTLCLLCSIRKACSNKGFWAGGLINTSRAKSLQEGVLLWCGRNRL